MNFTKSEISLELVLTPNLFNIALWGISRKCVSDQNLICTQHLIWSLFLSPLRTSEALLLCFYFWSFIEPRTAALHNSGASSFNRCFSCFLSLFRAVNSKTRQPYKWKLFRDGKMPAEREWPWKEDFTLLPWSKV